MKSIIYVTTSTSGSASIQRVLEALLVPPYRPMKEPPRIDGLGHVAKCEPAGHLYRVRGVTDVASPVFDPRFRYIVNFRDPRDTLCNQYYWLIQHPPGGNRDDEKQRKIMEDRKRRFDLGIDASVLRIKDDKAFRYVFEVEEAVRTQGADVLFISYAQLCCAFDVMVERLKLFLGVSPSPAAIEKLALERPDKLASNPAWIGQDWSGTDVMPGRHRRELKPETIATINTRFAATLERLKAMEVPELRRLYD